MTNPGGPYKKSCPRRIWNCYLMDFLKEIVKEIGDDFTQTGSRH